jgi:MoxR-like ATPase
MAVDFKTFISVVPHVTAVRKPVLVRGRHGVGKSQVVYQFAGHAGLPVVERRASQMTEGDLLGLPSTDGNVTSWNPPEWFKTACETPVVLFLDEVDRATPEVRQGIFELTDSRKLAGFTLHPETLIFAAVNGGEHGEQYQVGEMDPAELDRWTVFDVEPTVEDWLGWAKDPSAP